MEKKNYKKIYAKIFGIEQTCQTWQTVGMWVSFPSIFYVLLYDVLFHILRIIYFDLVISTRISSKNKVKMEKDELTLSFCFTQCWRIGAHHTRVLSAIVSVTKAKNKKNKIQIICDATGLTLLTSRKIQIRSRRVHKHRVPTNTFFF